MDAAYDSPQIHSFSRSLGHIPIIDNNPRRGEKIVMEPATKARFAERSSAERVNSNLKDNYGGRSVRVKGASKVMAHLMFGIISITAMQIFRLLMTTSAFIYLNKALLNKRGELLSKIGHFGNLKAFQQTFAHSESFSSQEIMSATLFLLSGR